MDDARIKQLTDAVLSKLALPAEPVAADLEARVADLEAEVQALRAALAARGAAAPAPGAVAGAVAIAVAAVPGAAHPSLRLLNVPSGPERCVLEPDQPCAKSGRCRAFGH